MTQTEAAEILGVSRRYVLTLERAGLLRAWRPEGGPRLGVWYYVEELERLAKQPIKTVVPDTEDNFREPSFGEPLEMHGMDPGIVRPMPPVKSETRVAPRALSELYACRRKREEPTSLESLYLERRSPKEAKAK